MKLDPGIHIVMHLVFFGNRCDTSTKDEAYIRVQYQWWNQEIFKGGHGTRSTSIHYTRGLTKTDFFTESRTVAEESLASLWLVCLSLCFLH
jgi:hypothetical protein